MQLNLKSSKPENISRALQDASSSSSMRFSTKRLGRFIRSVSTNSLFTLQQQDSPDDASESGESTQSTLSHCASDQNCGLTRSNSTGNFSSFSTVYASCNMSVSTRDTYKKDIARRVSEHKLQRMLGDVPFSLDSSSTRHLDKKIRRKSSQQKSQQSINKLRDLLGEDVSFTLDANANANPPLRSRHSFHSLSTESMTFPQTVSDPDIVSSHLEEHAPISIIEEDASPIKESFPTTYNNNTRANNPFQDLSDPTLLNTKQ